MANPEIPAFGDWETTGNTSYTQKFEDARKNKKTGIPAQPNDPRQNPGSPHKSPLHPTAYKTNPQDHGPWNPPQQSRPETDHQGHSDHPTHRESAPRRHSNAQREGGNASSPRSPYRTAAGSASPMQPNNQSKSKNRLTEMQTPERRVSSVGHGQHTPGKSRLKPSGYEPEEEVVVPPFGEWDDANAASGEKYIGIFNRVRDDRLSPNPSARQLSTTRGEANKMQKPEEDVAVPPFGEWDDANAASGEKYIDIFNRVRDDRLSPYTSARQQSTSRREENKVQKDTPAAAMEQENKEEEHGAPASASGLGLACTDAGAGASWRGGLRRSWSWSSWFPRSWRWSGDLSLSSGTNSGEEASAFASDPSKEHLFDKVLTPSDVGKLNRLVIPKQHAEKYFPLDASANETGLLLGFEDRAGKLWRFRYSYWRSSQSHVMTKGWSRFVKEKRLHGGDTISFSRGTGETARGRLFIDWKHRAADSPEPRRIPIEPLASACGAQVGKPHLTFHKDVKAWIAIKKQYEGDLHHSCMQVACKHVARNDIKEMIMEKILMNTYGGSNLTVICINGECGHGKTSLLRVLYNDQQLMDAFDKRIWIQMSDKLDIVMLYRNIIKFFMGDHCRIKDIRLLQEMVMDEIADKKLLLILDDADIEDQQFWSTVLEDFNASAKGSVVIMATRRSDVPTFRDVATHSYFLNPLYEENKVMLLQQYAVVGTDIQSNPDLLMVAQRLISRFGDNPLIIKAIGGLLCHADSSLEMEKFEDSVIPLQLCHDVLPNHLKKCLAFCSLFPEGYIFDKHHIVLQWISHGCVRPAEGCDLEDVGIEYFNELLCRSFFQYSPSHNDKDGKFVKHELMYKVVESVSRDKYFKSEAPMSSVPENIRHMSIVSSQLQTVELMHQTEQLNDLQTFMVVQPEWQPYKISFPTLKLVGLDDFFLKFTSIETLDLSHTDTEQLPGSIVGLKNLQYLSVSNTKIRSLPYELCSLSNLQTLEAKDCRFLTELPGDTKKLLKLRHLDVTKELDYVQLPQGIGQLTELQTLPVFHASSDPSHCSVSELGNLHNLRGCLQLSGLESVKTVSKAQEANLKDKHHLKDLTLQWHHGGIDIDDEDEEEDDTENVAEQVLGNLQPHTNLQELAIRGYEGSVFPAWMQGSSSLPNLVSLTLDSCYNCTQFPAIAQLPSLKFLSVRKMYDVNRLISRKIHASIMFPSLELLNLWEMYGLEELFEASEGDCPRLRKVCISRCPDLKMLPCTPVRELVLHCGHQLPDIPELASLVSLKIEGFHGVKSFILPVLPVLKKLEIRSCKDLSSVDGLSSLTSVQRLKIAGCPNLVLPTTDSLTT